MECILAIYTHMQHTKPCAYACAHTYCFYHMMSFVLGGNNYEERNFE